jgi:hypothetical protein
MGKPDGKRPLGRPRLSGWLILKCILEREVGVVLTGLIWLRTGASGGLL